MVKALIKDIKAGSDLVLKGFTFIANEIEVGKPGRTYNPNAKELITRLFYFFHNRCVKLQEIEDLKGESLWEQFKISQAGKDLPE